MRWTKVTCHYCGGKNAVTQDHIVPKALGGRNQDWNVVWSCQPCNSSKADSWPTCRCAKCRHSVTRHRERYNITRHKRRK